VGQKLGHFYEFLTPVYDDAERCFICQCVHVLIHSNTGILNIATFK